MLFPQNILRRFHEHDGDGDGDGFDSRDTVLNPYHLLNFFQEMFGGAKSHRVGSGDENTIPPGQGCLGDGDGDGDWDGTGVGDGDGDGITYMVCSHASRDARCGYCGPRVSTAIAQELKRRNSNSRVYQCSHLAGHKYGMCGHVDGNRVGDGDGIQHSHSVLLQLAM